MKRAAPSSPGLPAELTVCTAAGVRRDWLAWLAQAPQVQLRDPDGHCVLDGSLVDQVDAAGMQLLVSLSNTLQALQCQLRLANPSSPLREACTVFGLVALLVQDGSGAAR
jgi:ABC-type transporter Mla MlaB component